LQQIYAGIHKINEDGYKNTANIRGGAKLIGLVWFVACSFCFCGFNEIVDN
jgi:hypothetical protein